MEQVKTASFYKRLKVQTMNLSEGHRLFVLYYIGIIVGTLIINLLDGECVDKIGIYGNYLTRDVNIIEHSIIDKGEFFTYCIRKYYVQVFVVLILNLSSKNKIINSIICFYKGFVMSVLICAATISYGSGGIILFVISIFPHYLLYIPMFIYTLYFGMNIKEYVRNKNYISGICKGCIVESVLVVGTSFLEVYINLPLFINMFT